MFACLLGWGLVPSPTYPKPSPRTRGPQAPLPPPPPFWGEAFIREPSLHIYSVVLHGIKKSFCLNIFQIKMPRSVFAGGSQTPQSGVIGCRSCVNHTRECPSPPGFCRSSLLQSKTLPPPCLDFHTRRVEDNRAVVLQNVAQSVFVCFCAIVPR